MEKVVLGYVYVRFLKYINILIQDKIALRHARY
jgi:hypothetical protein